jgi:hypothetical protein
VLRKPRPIRKTGMIERRPDGGLLLIEDDGLPWRIDCDVAQHMQFMRRLGTRVTVSGYPYSETWFSVLRLIAPSEA